MKLQKSVEKLQLLVPFHINCLKARNKYVTTAVNKLYIT